MKKLLMIVSGPPNYGKTKSLKEFVKLLLADPAFCKECSVYTIENSGTVYNDIKAVPPRKMDKGDWTVTFYKSAKDKAAGKPCGYIVTAGDTATPKMKNLYVSIFGMSSVEFVVGAARPWNNVHRFLLEEGAKYGFVNVGSSPFGHYISAANPTALLTKYQTYANELKAILLKLYL